MRQMITILMLGNAALFVFDGSSQATTTLGKVVGVDYSDLMHGQAARRNARAIEAGLVELHIAPVDAMPAFDSPFDKVLAVNVYMFWPDPVRVLARVAAVMKPGGSIALTFQLRSRGATNEDTRRSAERIAESLRAAGFNDVRAEILPMKPVRCSLRAGTSRS